MTAAAKAIVLDDISVDAPMFPADAFRLTDEQAALTEKVRRFGKTVVAPRAAKYDRDATFPIENFRDMHGEGLLSLCIPDLLPRRRRARPLLRRDHAVVEHACLLNFVVGHSRRRTGDDTGRSRRT
jgi:hypothetical protein